MSVTVTVVDEVALPANPEAVRTAVLELNEKFVLAFGGWFPEDARANKGKQVVSVDSAATVTLVAVVAVVAVAALPVVL